MTRGRGVSQRREEYHKEEKSITRKNDMFVKKQITHSLPSPLLGFARRTEAPHAPSPGRQSWRASRGVSSPSTQAPAVRSAQSSTLRLRHASRLQWRSEPTPPPPRPPARASSARAAGSLRSASPPALRLTRRHSFHPAPPPSFHPSPEPISYLSPLHSDGIVRCLLP